jgi:hypothetical protein
MNTFLRPAFRKISYYLQPDRIVYLGRWKIDTCEKTRSIKTQWANEDHCGTCTYSTLVVEDTLDKTFLAGVHVPKQPTHAF